MGWSSFLRGRRRASNKASSRRPASAQRRRLHLRPLRLEPLESRELLSLTWYGDWTTVDGKSFTEWGREIRQVDGKWTEPTGSVVALGRPTNNNWTPYVYNHFAYAELDPAESYEITVGYDLNTWWDYRPTYGRIFPDPADGELVLPKPSAAFSVSVMDAPPIRNDPWSGGGPNASYQHLTQHPLNFPGLGFTYGGSDAYDDKLESKKDTTTIEFPGDSVNPKYLVLAHTFNTIKPEDIPPINTNGGWIRMWKSGAYTTPYRYVGGGEGHFWGPSDWGTFTISLRDVEAKDLVRKPDGGATFAYALSTDKIPNIPINFYWAKGEKKEDILGSLDQPFFDYVLITPDRKEKGDHTGEIPKAKLAAPPLGATHVIMLVDPKGVVDESDRDNNLKAMPVTGLAPLQIEVVGGKFKYDDKNKRHKAEGTMLVGLAPAAGQAFEPYVSLVGSAWYDSAILHMEGTFNLACGPLHPTLYSGVLEYQVGKIASKSATDSPTPPPPESAYKIAGAGVHVTGIRFGVNGLGLQGSVEFPQSLGGLKIEVQDKNWLLINRNGEVSMTGIKFRVKDFSIYVMPPEAGKPPEADFKAKNMSVEYVVATATEPSKFILRGEVSLPKLGDLTANFAGENYIQYANGQLDCKGKISLGSIEFVKDKWELKEAYVELDTINRVYKGGGEMLIPAGFSVGGSVGFRKGRFNYVSVKVDDLGWPIGTTGWLLQRIEGEVDHLATGGVDPDPEPISFGGGVTFTMGSKITLSKRDLGEILDLVIDPLPGEGDDDDEGEYTFGLAQIDLNAKIDKNHLTGDGKLHLLFMGDPSDPSADVKSVIKATVNTDFDWSKKKITGKGTFNLLGDLAVATGNFSVDSQGTIQVNASGTARLPNIKWTPLKGQSLGTGSMMARYTHDDNLTDDYVALSGTIDLGRVLGRQVFGVKIPLEGKTQFFGNLAELQRLTASASSGPHALMASAEPGDGYEIAAGTEKAVLYLEWENDVGSQAIEIVAPDGTVYTEAQIDVSSTMSMVDAFGSATSKAVAILNPAAGNWRIRPVGATDLLGIVESTGLAGTKPPTLELNRVWDVYDPGSLFTGIFADYQASDPDSPFTVDFFVDTDNTGADGIPVTAHAWGSLDIDAVPPGTYWVYAVASDGQNPPVVVYAPNPVTRWNPGPQSGGWYTGDEMPGSSTTVRTGDTLEIWAKAFPGWVRHNWTDPSNPTSTLTFSLPPGAPQGAAITPEGLLTYTPDPHRLGSYRMPITVQITDGFPESLGPNSTTSTLQVDVLGSRTARGAIDQSGQVAVWRMAAQTGQRFVYTPADDTDDTLHVAVAAPDGSLLYEGPANVAGPFSMPADGLFTVTISGEAGTGIGKYQFSCPPVLLANELVEDTMFHADERIVEYYFDATAGQSVFLQDVTTLPYNWYIEYRLIAPNGTTIGLKDVIRGIDWPEEDWADGGSHTFDQSGLYRLQVEYSRGALVWLRFRLSDLSTATPLGLDQEVQTNFSNIDEMQLFSFTGNAGDWIEAQGYYAGEWWGQNAPLGSKILDPHGRRFDFYGGDYRLRLPETGAYTLIVPSNHDGENVANWHFRFVRPQTHVQPLVFNQIVVSTAGALEQYNFSGSAGQMLYYQNLGNVTTKYLIGPSGLLLEGRRESALLILPEAGQYSLLLTSQPYGSYQFKVTDVAGLPALPLDTWVTDTLPTNSKDVNVYRYRGTAGEAIRLRMQESTGGAAAWTVFDPSGNPVAYEADDLAAYLPVTGDYAFLYRGASATSQFQITRDPIVTRDLAIGDRAQGAVGRGEHHLYRFQGAAGQRLLLKSGLWTKATARIFSPNGVWLHSDFAFADSGILVLPESGQYTLVIELHNADPSTYNVRLIDLDAAPPALGGTPPAGVLGGAYDQKWYQFEGQAGQVVTFDDDFELGHAGTKTIFGSAFQTIACGALGSLLSVTLPATGNYFFVITSGSSAVQPFAVAPTIETPVNHRPTAANDAARVAPAGSVVLDVLGNDADADQQGLVATIVAQPTHGTLEAQPDGSFLYAVENGFTGTDTFTYKASDGTAESDVAQVTVAVNGVPTAAGNSYSTDEDQPLTVAARGVLLGDNDPDADVLASLLLTTPAHGEITLETDGSFTYLPGTDYFGPDSFTYAAWDGISQSPPATVAITVNNLPPRATVARAAGQGEWVAAGQARFAVTFTDPVADFEIGDVILGSTAPGATIESLTPVGADGKTYALVVSGMTGSGTIQPTIPAGKVHDSAGLGNLASTGTGIVRCDLTRPAAVLANPPNQAWVPAWMLNQQGHIRIAPSDTGGSGLDPATIFDAEPEFILVGAAAAGVTISPIPLLLSDNTYLYDFTGAFAPGMVSVQFPAGAFFDLAGNANTAVLSGLSFTVTGSGGNGTVTEGQAGKTTAVFTVALAGPSSQTVKVSYATADGTATLAGKDYTKTRGVLTFKRGETTKTVRVSVKPDRLFEDDETFQLLLSSATPGALPQTALTGTILNDDRPPAVSIANAKLAEGKAGTKAMNFTVTLSAASGKPVSVAYATADGSATTADGDYQAVAGTLTFNPGQTKKTIRVPVHGDVRYEGTEAYQVNLSGPTDATLARATATGTITNDDAMPTLSIADTTFDEPAAATAAAMVFTVTLSAPSGLPVTVSYATVHGTAVAGSDYTEVKNTLTFAPGETTKTISVDVLGDTNVEKAEKFSVKLSRPSGAKLKRGIATGTIQDAALASLMASAASPGLDLKR